MAMKFYMTPGSCSMGIHILLEEIGLVFEAYIINLQAKDQYKKAYLAINPKATVPTLVREDGTALTEFQAIAWWLARRHPEHGLLPDTPDQEARVLEVMNYVVNTLHDDGFTRFFVPEKFTCAEHNHDAVKSQGLEIIDKSFIILNHLLDGQQYVLDHFSIADAAVFYVEFWAERSAIPLPENCRVHYQHLLKRPAVRRVLMEEGYASIVMR